MNLIKSYHEKLGCQEAYQGWGRLDCCFEMSRSGESQAVCFLTEDTEIAEQGFEFRESVGLNFEFLKNSGQRFYSEFSVGLSEAGERQ